MALRAPRPTLLATRWRRGAVVAPAALFAAAVTLALSASPSFEYDEAVYATMARAWAKGTPDTGAALVRAPGLPTIGSVIARFSEWEAAFRAVGLAFGIGVVASAWALARSLGGTVTAVVAVGALVASPELQLRSSQFATDVPAVAVLLVAMAVLWRQMERSSPPGAGLLAVGALAAAAFYLRYASVVPIVAVAVASVVLWGGALRRNWRWPAATVGLLALLLVPHLAHSVEHCGSPWGVLALTSRWAGQYRDGVGHGLVDYARWLPWRLAGPAAGALMLVALAAGSLHLVLRRPGHATRHQRQERGQIGARALAFLVVPAVVHVVVLGVTNRGEPRFALFSTTLLTIAGAAVIAGWRRHVRRAGAVVVALALAAAFVAGTRSVVRTSQRQARARAVLADAGRAVRRSTGVPCSAISVGVPIMTWYSGCATSAFGERFASGPGPRFVVVVDDYRLKVPRRVVLPYLEAVGSAPIATLRSNARRTGEATIYRVDDDVASAAEASGPSPSHSCELPARRF